MLTDSACSRPADLAAYVTCQGKTYRLPGPLALVQTEGSGAHCVTTHVNDLSLADIAATCPEATAEELAAGGCLTCVSRGGVTVQGLTVVAVHAGLLVPAAAEAGGDGEAQQQRALMRAAARLTWGLAGLVFELMHCQAGHWPSLASPTRRQEVAGAALTQLYRLNRGLALAVLRAYGLLTPERFDEMLEHGLLPQPRKAAAAPAEEGPRREPQAEEVQSAAGS